jgi:hypothetical protein
MCSCFHQPPNNPPPLHHLSTTSPPPLHHLSTTSPPPPLHHLSIPSPPPLHHLSTTSSPPPLSPLNHLSITFPSTAHRILAARLQTDRIRHLLQLLLQRALCYRCHLLGNHFCIEEVLGKAVAGIGKKLSLRSEKAFVLRSRFRFFFCALKSIPCSRGEDSKFVLRNTEYRGNTDIGELWN